MNIHRVNLDIFSGETRTNFEAETQTCQFNARACVRACVRACRVYVRVLGLTIDLCDRLNASKRQDNIQGAFYLVTQTFYLSWHSINNKDKKIQKKISLKLRLFNLD